VKVQEFRYVDYLWDLSPEAERSKSEIDLFLYRSNLLGTDLRITNFGGGNTSCKTMENDPLTGDLKEVMWVKGSGGDLGTLKRDGIAGLYVERLHTLKNVYRGLEFEDEIVPLYYHCLFDLDSKAPSIDTALHGLLPFKHIDHLHPDSVIAVAAAKGSKEITREIWGDAMGWLPWQRPGFDLGVQLEKCVKENPKIRGIVLGSHGLFTWGNTSKACYLNSLEVIEKASAFIEEKRKASPIIFGGARSQPVTEPDRKKQAAQLAPVLRGLCSTENRMIGHFTNAEEVLEFVNSTDLDRLAPMGTSCPDHFLRTKIQPLILSLPENLDFLSPDQLQKLIEPQFEKYREHYQEYYQSCRDEESPPMRDPNPVVILCPGIGMFTFAKNKQTARVASEFYINAINVMRGAEVLSEYTSLPRQEAFNIEYWALEEAKLQRQPAEKPLSRRVALITGAGGGIGLAIANKVVQQGACVVLTDVSSENLEEACTSFTADQSCSQICDVTNEEDIGKAFETAALNFGGVDIVVHSAGLAISKPLEAHTLDDWNVLQDVMVKGQFLLARRGTEIMRQQGFGGDIINVASKNGLVAGPNNVGYGTAKAAQQHMTRLLAAELAADGIRVNTINPDAVIIGSKIWEGKWAEGRAKAHGVEVKDLPRHYADRNLLKEIILPDDIANAVVALLSLLTKTTGNIINVDGGITGAFPR